MILFTKEIFVQLKKLSVIHINSTNNVTYRDNIQQSDLNWQVFIMGTTETGHDNDLQAYINCASKEDAYRVYKDLLKQVADSGEIPKLTDKQFDEMLEEKTHGPV